MLSSWQVLVNGLWVLGVVSGDCGMVKVKGGMVVIGRGLASGRLTHMHDVCRTSCRVLGARFRWWLAEGAPPHIKYTSSSHQVDVK